MGGVFFLLFSVPFFFCRPFPFSIITQAFLPASPAAAASSGGGVDTPPQRGHPADARAGAGAAPSPSASAAAGSAAEAEPSAPSAAPASASLFPVVRRGVGVEDRLEKAREGADDREEEGEDRGVPGRLLDDGACCFLGEGCGSFNRWRWGKKHMRCVFSLSLSLSLSPRSPLTGRTSPDVGQCRGKRARKKEPRLLPGMDSKTQCCRKKACEKNTSLFFPSTFQKKRNVNRTTGG